MNTRISVLVAAAASGLLLAGSGCAKTNPDAQSPGSSSMSAMGSKHSCKGQNDCKGHGGCKSSQNGCKGKNDCKGQGGCKTA
jgi:hypothetical protein